MILQTGHPIIDSQFYERSFWMGHVGIYGERWPPFHPRQRMGAPIHRLPFEVMSNIFLATLDTPKDPCLIPSRDRLTHQAGFPPDHTPLFLGQVCRRWRSLALSIPQLWSTITLPYLSDSRMKLASLWLLRSGKTTPLSLTICQTANPWTPPESSIDRLTRSMLDLLIPKVHRWKEINFILARLAVPYEPLISCIADGCATSLEVARFWAPWPDPAMFRFWESIGTSPRLRTVDWAWFCTDRAPISGPRLKDVAMYAATAELLLDLLASCPMIEALWVLELEDSGVEVPATMVTLPHLKEFYLLQSCVDPRLIFDRLTAPSLHTISCTAWVGEDGMASTQELTALFARSRCRLTTLTFWVEGLAEHDILAFLGSPQLAHLERLRLESDDDDSTLLALMPLVHRPGPLLPSLKLLQCGAHSQTLQVFS